MAKPKAFDLKKFAEEVHALAKEKGFYSPPRSDLESLALIHSEISEVVEEVRSGEAREPIYFAESMKPEGELIELADAVIRILDYCEWKGYNLVHAMEMKHRYNHTRPYRHGGKKA